MAHGCTILILTHVLCHVGVACVTLFITASAKREPCPQNYTLCRTQNPLSDDSRTRPSPERRPFKRPFLFSTHSHVASRGSGGGATVAKPTRSDAGTVLHAFRTLCAVRSCCLATGGAARCSAAGERLIALTLAGHKPAVFGRVASAGAKSDCVLEVLECPLTPWAPRSDLHHRSGQGAFERLRAASPEVGIACRVAGG